MKKVILILEISLIICGALAGCKKKSEEEQIGELLEKLGEAKTEKEADEIAKRIEALEEKVEKRKNKRIETKLGRPFRAIVHEPYTSNLVSQYSITFDRTGYRLIGPSGDDKTVRYVVTYRYKNLGPRKGSPYVDKPELKVKTGYIYSGHTLTEWGSTKETQPGEEAEKTLAFQIPFDAVPVETTGTISDSSTTFSLRLPKVPISEAEVEIPAESYQNSIRLLKCYLTGLGRNPHIHLEYENVSDQARQVLIVISWRDTDGKYKGQEDLRGPFFPSKKEKLTYQLIEDSPQENISYKVSISSGRAKGGGITPIGWNPGRFPRVGPTKVNR